MKKTAKSIRKPLVCIASAVMLLFGMAACNLDTSGETYHGRTHYGNTLSINGQQVWERNYTVNKISQMYTRFEGNDNIMIITELGELVGFGAIRKGIMDLNIHEPEFLLNWDTPQYSGSPPREIPPLNRFFEIMAEGVGWDDVRIDDETTKGTFILPETYDFSRALMREGVAGTNNSISFETVYFIYVDKNCKITSNSRLIKPFAYTLNAFTLNLVQGWNTICFKQTYTTPGNSTFSMEIKNPDLKWVLIP